MIDLLTRFLLSCLPIFHCFFFFSYNHFLFLQLFINHEVLDPKAIKLKWGKVDEEGLLQYLVEEKGFNLERTQRQIARLVKAKGSATQKRMDSFFTRKPSTSSSNKRKADSKSKGKNKKGKTSGGKKR